MSAFFIFGIFFTALIFVISVPVWAALDGINHAKSNENRYVISIEESLIDSGYEKKNCFPLFDENALDGKLMLNSFFKGFNENYVIKISTESKIAESLSDVCWTIWYRDGSKEWGSTKDVSFGFNPKASIATLENHAQLAYEYKTKK